MAIPTLTEWKKSTKHIGKRSYEMGIIDDKIREYWHTGDRQAENKAAYGILKACRHWKRNHQNSKRMDKVNDLEQEASAWLLINQPGWNAFVQSKQGGRAGNLTSLAKGYDHERRMYVKDKKQVNPIAAGFIRDQAWMDAREADPTDQRTENAILKDLGNEEWDGYAYHQAIASMPQNRVLYFDKQERLEHMLLVQQGRLVWARNGAYFGTPHGQPFMYAMDGYCNLFACVPSGVQGFGGFFNHSSFNAGREVICAGMIAANAGYLDFISNESGHYQPSRGALYSCVQKLLAANVTMVFGNHIGGGARTRVRAMRVGDWPAIHYGNTPGFDQVYAATAGHPPAATPNPPTCTRWTD